MADRPTDILGYCEPLASRAGGTVQLKLSSNGPERCDIEILRVVCADIDPNGPGAEFERQDWGGHSGVEISHQPINAGSCAVARGGRLPGLDWSAPFEFTARLWPTNPAAGRQAVLSWGPLWVGINGGGQLAAHCGGAELACMDALRGRRWVEAVLAVDPTAGRMTLSSRGIAGPGGRAAPEEVSGDLPGGGAPPGEAPLLLAASGAGAGEGRLATGEHFNGKIDGPAIRQGGRDVCRWDFGRGQSGAGVEDLGDSGCALELLNGPMRAATGHLWDGSVDSWTERPEHYSAIHFHDDDLTDCMWATTREIAIPEDARSGYYIARMTAGGCVSDVAFFVSARPGGAGADTLFIAPTATYLSYANTHIKFDSHNTENLYEAPMVLSREEMYLNEHRELGLSHYDTHSDGSGVVHASERRPMLNMKPGLYTFNYVNDTHIIKWLEGKGFDYDVATDRDLHEHGADLLSGYRVIVTGSHPEYYSTEMWDAVHAFQEGGGRHLYLGGNGFYWRIGWPEAMPGVVENRRGVSGVRTWEGEPGEHHLASTGEPGGLWRSNGRAPQALVGVGFSSTLFVRSTHFRRTRESRDGRVGFVFEGVEGGKIGDFGYRGGGAVGMEIDRYDTGLGSRHDAIVLATSEGIDQGGLLSGEEYITTTRALDGGQNALVRADMVISPTGGGGAVWSTGSIAWATSMTWNGGDNDVSRITENVLNRFLDPEPLALVPGNSEV